jgi:hypothetical protein
VAFGLVPLALCTAAFAGMPSPTLTDAGRLRLQSLGFFVALFFVLAKLCQLLWNWLRADFPSMPHLGFRRAMALVFLWGMALELVLTMISGARELLTPGAWEKVGVTYQLKPASPGGSADFSMAGRRARLERLAAALKAQPALPRSARASGLPDDAWTAPGGARYVYLGEFAAKVGILAYEPPTAGAERLVILDDYSVTTLSADAIHEKTKAAFR